MSQSRGADEDTDMAISYTQPSTGHPHQTLPSFREVKLPDRLDYTERLTSHSCSPPTCTMRLNQPPHTTPPLAKSVLAQATR